MDEGVLLKQAMNNIAMKRLMAELREAIVMGPPILAEIYAEFQQLQSTQKQEDDNA